MAPAKIMFVVILSFIVALQCEFTSIIIVIEPLTRKHKEKKFVILQSIGIIVIKSRETTEAIYIATTADILEKKRKEKKKSWANLSPASSFFQILQAICG